MIQPASLVVLALLLVAIARRSRVTAVVAVAAGLPTTDLIAVSGIEVPAFHGSAMVLIAVVVLGLLPRRDVAQHCPGALAITAFAFWAVLVTALSPAVLAGLPVLRPRGGIDEEVVNPSALTFTISNVAQVIYLLIGVAFIFCIATRKESPRNVIGWSLATMLALSFIRLIVITAGYSWPSGVLEPKDTYFIESTPSGEPRFRGIFGEPSALGSRSVVAAFYFATLGLQARSTRVRLAAFAAVVIAALLAAVSTATTAWALALAGSLALAGFHIARFFLRLSRPRPVVVGGAAIIAAACLPLLPTLITAVQMATKEKAEGLSFYSRTTADLFSLRLTYQTAGFGVGLGSNRPSTFLPGLLSAVGLVGVTLLVVGLIQVVWAAYRHVEARPAVLAFALVMLGKSISGSDLSDPMLWLCLAVLCWYAWSPPTGSERIGLSVITVESKSADPG